MPMETLNALLGLLVMHPSTIKSNNQLLQSFLMTLLFGYTKEERESWDTIKGKEVSTTLESDGLSHRHKVIQLGLSHLENLWIKIFDDSKKIQAQDLILKSLKHNSCLIVFESGGLDFLPPDMKDSLREISAWLSKFERQDVEKTADFWTHLLLNYPFGLKV